MSRSYIRSALPALLLLVAAVSAWADDDMASLTAEQRALAVQMQSYLDANVHPANPHVGFVHATIHFAFNEDGSSPSGHAAPTAGRPVIRRRLRL